MRVPMSNRWHVGNLPIRLRILVFHVECDHGEFAPLRTQVLHRTMSTPLVALRDPLQLLTHLRGKVYGTD